MKPPSAFLALAVLCTFATVARADEKAEILAAAKWAAPVMGTACNFSLLRGDEKLGGSRHFEIHYRDRGQDQDSPDNVYPLFQLLCNRAAYNETYIYLTRNGDGYSLLSFAEPRLDYDYADESFARLKAPPKVVGYRATTELVGADFDAATQSITTHVKWRGLGDAWSSGVWKFSDGEFVLKQYDVDPTYDNHPDAGSADKGENYQVYPEVRIRP